MNEFLAGCRHLCDLRPTVYRMADLRHWTESQLAEELAAVAMEDDAP